MPARRWREPSAACRRKFTSLLHHLCDQGSEAICEAPAILTDPRVHPAMLAADPEAMRGLLVGLRADFGPVEGYLTHLGMASVVPHLRANLLSR